MAIYRALTDIVMKVGIIKAGTEFEYDGVSEGKPGENMELVKGTVKTSKAAKQAASVLEPSAQNMGAAYEETLVDPGNGTDAMNVGMGYVENPDGV